MKKIKFNPFYFYFGIVILFFLLILFHHFKAIDFNCYNNNDLGIYTQAILELSTFKSFNPFITVRGIPLFQDHFDPILIVIGSLLKVLHLPLNSYSFVFMEQFFFFLFLILFSLFYRIQNLKVYSLLLIITLFAKPLLIPLLFPVHPITWSILPILIFFFLIKNYFTGAIENKNIIKYRVYLICCSLFLLSFREEFPFALLSVGISILFLYRKDFKLGMAFIFISFSWIFGVFFLRSHLLGPTIGYGSHLLDTIMISPFHYFLSAFVNFLKVYNIYLPLLTIFICFYQCEISKENNLVLKKEKILFLLVVLSFILPLLGIRFIFSQHAFHYSAPLYAATISLLLFSDLKKWISRKWPLYLIVAIFLSTSLSSYKKIAQFIIFDKGLKCEVTSEMREEDLLLKSYLQNFTSFNIIATGGVIPKILRPNLNLYHLGGYLPSALFDQSNRDKGFLLLLENSSKANIWPLTETTLMKLQQCLGIYGDDQNKKPYTLIELKSELMLSCLKPFEKN